MVHELSDGEAFELFRRAIVDRSAEAWAGLYAQYHTLMLGWAHHYCNKNYLGDSPEDIADRAFMRAWLALRESDHFEQFHSVASLLAYLRTCVSAAVIDDHRSVLVHDRLCHRIELAPIETPEDEITNAVLFEEVRNILALQSLSLQERIVLSCTFVDGLPPREILRRHPELFSTIQDVYMIKRNVYVRLERCQHLRRVYEQLSA